MVGTPLQGGAKKFRLATSHPPEQNSESAPDTTGCPHKTIMMTTLENWKTLLKKILFLSKVIKMSFIALCSDQTFGTV